MTHLEIARANGITDAELSVGKLAVYSPIDGGLIGRLPIPSAAKRFVTE